MNRALASKVVESLSAQHVPEAVYEDMKQFDSTAWQGTMWWLSASGLPHYFLARLQHSGRENVLPPVIHAAMSGNFLSNQQRVDTMSQEFEILTRRMCDAGVNYAAVRGFELAPEYCSNLWLRTWYTHEYVVSAEQLGRASEVVEQSGYPLRQSGSRGELYFAAPEMQPPSKIEDAYSGAFPRMVVLHSQMWDRHGTGIDASAPKNLLQRVVTRRSHGMSFQTLADDDLLAVTLMESFARVLNYWCKLSWLLEISHFLRVRLCDDAFWESFYARITDCGKLAEIADFVFSLCASIFEENVPDAVRYRISRLSPPLALWIRHYGKQWGIAEYPGSKLSLLVQQELISDRTKWKRLERRRLFPISKGQMNSSSSATSPKREKSKPKISRMIDRIRFHGPATYEYLRELPRWKRLLAPRS